MSDSKFLIEPMVRAFIESFPEGQMFSVTFEKADGTLRRMSCRQGVTKHLKGGEATYDANPHNLGVFDVEAGEYRCFNATRVIGIRGGGGKLESAAGLPEDAVVVNARGEPVKKT